MTINMKKWIFDSIKYALVWMFGLGIVTVIIAPLYEYLLETIGGWVYLSFAILGVLTKLYFIKTQKYNEAGKEN